MTTFTHHPFKAPESWEFDPTRTYSQEHAWAKPVGLWLSVDDDWRRWCQGEGMDYADAAPIAFEVDTDRCLWLKSPDDLDRFHAEYVAGGDPYRIDWSPVIDAHAGIIIAPYQWTRRLDGDASRWYYPWDCASACIWDLSAVALAEVEAVSA